MCRPSFPHSFRSLPSRLVSLSHPVAGSLANLAAAGCRRTGCCGGSQRGRCRPGIAPALSPPPAARRVSVDAHLDGDPGDHGAVVGLCPMPSQITRRDLAALALAAPRLNFPIRRDYLAEPDVIPRFWVSSFDDAGRFLNERIRKGTRAGVRLERRRPADARRFLRRAAQGQWHHDVLRFAGLRRRARLHRAGSWEEGLPRDGRGARRRVRGHCGRGEPAGGARNRRRTCADATGPRSSRRRNPWTASS